MGDGEIGIVGVVSVSMPVGGRSGMCSKAANGLVKKTIRAKSLSLFGHMKYPPFVHA